MSRCLRPVVKFEKAAGKIAGRMFDALPQKLFRLHSSAQVDMEAACLHSQPMYPSLNVDSYDRTEEMAYTVRSDMQRSNTMPHECSDCRRGHFAARKSHPASKDWSKNG